MATRVKLQEDTSAPTLACVSVRQLCRGSYWASPFTWPCRVVAHLCRHSKHAPVRLTEKGMCCPQAQAQHLSQPDKGPAQAQQPGTAVPLPKPPLTAAQEAAHAARGTWLRSGAAPPSTWDARGLAVYLAFMATAAAYFWVRAEGLRAMGPYAWCGLSGSRARCPVPCDKVETIARSVHFCHYQVGVSWFGVPGTIEHVFDVCAARRYGVLVLLGEALGACSVVLYGLCIIRRSLPLPREPARGNPAAQPFSVQVGATASTAPTIFATCQLCIGGQPRDAGWCRCTYAYIYCVTVRTCSSPVSCCQQALRRCCHAYYHWHCRDAGKSSPTLAARSATSTLCVRAQVLVPCYTEALDIVAESVWAAHVAQVPPRLLSLRAPGRSEAPRPVTGRSVAQKPLSCMLSQLPFCRRSRPG